MLIAAAAAPAYSSYFFFEVAAVHVFYLAFSLMSSMENRERIQEKLQNVTDLTGVFFSLLA